MGITSGAHGRTSAANTGRGAVELTAIATVGTAATSANATYEYIDLWSRSTTWGGGPPPVEGDTVWIQPGQSTPNPNLNSNPNSDPDPNPNQAQGDPLVGMGALVLAAVIRPATLCDPPCNPM